MARWSRLVSLRGLTGALGILFVCAGMLLVLPLSKAFSEIDPGTPVPPVSGIQDGGTIPDLPGLTDAQKASAVSIAQANPHVQSFFSQPGASTLVVPWMTVGTHQLLGAGIDLTWISPMSVTDQWPVLFYDETETVTPPYQTTTASITVDNLTGVHLAIDLNQKKVLGIEAMPEANVTTYILPQGFQNNLPTQPTSD